MNLLERRIALREERIRSIVKRKANDNRWTPRSTSLELTFSLAWIYMYFATLNLFSFALFPATRKSYLCEACDLRKSLRVVCGLRRVLGIPVAMFLSYDENAEKLLRLFFFITEKREREPQSCFKKSVNSLSVASICIYHNEIKYWFFLVRFINCQSLFHRLF